MKKFFYKINTKIIMKTLIIVESVQKAKKFQSYLNNDYIVKASIGHIRQLKDTKGDMGIDVKNNFKPEYVISKDKKKVVDDLKSAQKYCSEVILASDLDREGEAIAWHLAEVLHLKNPKRIVFTDTTKDTFLKALKKTRPIDMDLVYAQQGRQVLDKLVGYDLSPLLWKHVVNALSAGRVQSVTTRLVYDKEKEIEKFETKPYYKTVSNFTNNLNADLNKNFEENKDALKFLEDCKIAIFQIEDIQKKRTERKPSPPFDTSSLQQEAGSKLNMSSKIIMNNAQTLYENGYITYHRTDCIDIAPSAQKDIKKYVLDNYGDKYLKLRKYTTKTENAQEAHECIRPTDIFKENINDSDLTNQQKKLYEMIWKRTIASQMTACEVDVYQVIINILVKDKLRDEKFIAKAEKIIFPGFKVIYDYKDYDNDSSDDDNDNSDKQSKNLKIIESLKIGDKLIYHAITSTEKFTKPTPRYSEATLTKKMKTVGIGRPATTASMITKIQDRKYVTKETRKGKKVPYKIYTLKNNEITFSEKETMLQGERNKLFITETGKEVTEFLIKYFPDIMDYKFTSNVEKELDEIAKGKKIWNNVIKSFYDNYHPTVMTLQKQESKIPDEKKSPKKDKRLVGIDQNTGKNIYAYNAKFGPVLQIGDSNPDKDNNDIKFVSLKEPYTIQSITEEEANKLLQYPRSIGQHNGKDVIIKDGQYGYYLFYDGKNYPIKEKEGRNKEDISMDEAIEMIEEKDNKTIKVFNKMTKINNGPYGPYIIHGKKLVSVPKTIDDPSALSLDEVKEIVKNYKPSEKKSPTKNSSSSYSKKTGGNIKRTVTRTKKTKVL